jgi:hypothetical protein
MEPFAQIVSPEQVDARWLDAALKPAGIGLGCVVDTVEATPIGTGQVGDNYRYSLVWQAEHSFLEATNAGGQPPASVVIKFPASDPASRAAAIQVETYVKEVGFYRDLALSVDTRVPSVYHCGWNPQTHDFVLVMQDLSPAVPGDQLAGGSVQQAAAALAEISKLHGATWGASSTWPSWLKIPDDESRGLLGALLTMLAPGFFDRYRGSMTAEHLAVGEQLVANYPTWSEEVRQWGEVHGWCAIHNDFRLDNLLFESGEEVTAYVVDWQTVTVGIGPLDVAYYLSAGLALEERRSSEARLLSRYAERLAGHGVELSDSAMAEGYALGSAAGFIMAIIASQLVGRTERGDQMFEVMAAGSAAMMLDHGLPARW